MPINKDDFSPQPLSISLTAYQPREHRIAHHKCVSANYGRTSQKASNLLRRSEIITNSGHDVIDGRIDGF